MKIESGNIDDFLRMLNSRPLNEYDCNHSKFDLCKHADTYINYLEIVISEDGDIYYATPSHTMFLENIYKMVNGISHDEFVERTKVCDAYNDYAGWLCKQTGFIMVWNDFFVGKPNSVQMDTLLLLSKRKYTKADSFLYSGNL